MLGSLATVLKATLEPGDHKINRGAKEPEVHNEVVHGCERSDVLLATTTFSVLVV